METTWDFCSGVDPWNMYWPGKETTFIISRHKGKVVRVQDLKAYGGGGGASRINPVISNVDILWRWVISFTRRLLYPPVKSPNYLLNKGFRRPHYRIFGRKKYMFHPLGVEPWYLSHLARIGHSGWPWLLARVYVCRELFCVSCGFHERCKWCYIWSVCGGKIMACESIIKT
jgi:hypothetical protein